MKFNRSTALIGAGYWGKNIVRNLNELGALHTICENNEERQKLFAKQYPDVSITSNYEQVLQNPDILQVMIAAPATLHYQLAKQSLLAKKHTYVEKPLCLNSKEGEELVAIAKENNLVLMVGHLLQYHPCVIKLQEMIANGEIGKLQYIISNRVNLGSYRTEENALWNFAPHDISVILSLVNSSLPTKVRAIGSANITNGVEDMTMTILNFSDDIKAHIYVSWLHPFKEQKLIIIGSLGMIIFDDTKPWEEKLLIHRDHICWSKEKLPLVNNREAKKVEVKYSEPLKDECIHFLRCCEKGQTPKTDGEEGLKVLKVLQAAQKSLEEDGEAKDPEKEHLNAEKKFKKACLNMT